MGDDETGSNVKQLAAFIQDHKGEDVVCIDVSEVSSWASYFIITTVTSMGHMRGLIRELRSELQTLDMSINHKHKKIAENGWELIDCGDVVIHVMTEEMRQFYELEKLWYAGKVLEFTA